MSDDKDETIETLTLEELIELARQLPPMTPEQRREHAICWALGNLNCSTNHQTTREVVEAAYDRLHPPPVDGLPE